MNTTEQTAPTIQTHTPGPWIVGKRYGNNRTEIASPGYSSVLATVWTHNRNRTDKAPRGDDDYSECEAGMANARLIAAAPDLLESLTRTLALSMRYYESLPDDGVEQDYYMSSVIEPAHMAIAKASGLR